MGGGWGGEADGVGRGGAGGFRRGAFPVLKGGAFGWGGGWGWDGRCGGLGGGLPPVLEATEVPVPQATQSDALKARFAENHLPKERGQ